jgi:hypothetical protein
VKFFSAAFLRPGLKKNILCAKNTRASEQIRGSFVCKSMANSALFLIKAINSRAKAVHRTFLLQA